MNQLRRFGLPAVLAGLSFAAGGASAAPAVVALSGPANGRAVHVERGEEIVVTLHSTYWSFERLRGQALRPVGSPVYHPARVGSCVPGAGCGTVTARYRAVTGGVVTIRAGRTSCGEALLCAPSQRGFRVAITVTH